MRTHTTCSHTHYLLFMLLPNTNIHWLTALTDIDAHSLTPSATPGLLPYTLLKSKLTEYCPLYYCSLNALHH